MSPNLALGDTASPNAGYIAVRIHGLMAPGEGPFAGPAIRREWLAGHRAEPLRRALFEQHGIRTGRAGRTDRTRLAGPRHPTGGPEAVVESHPASRSRLVIGD